MLPESFRCYLVRKLGPDRVEAGVEERPTRDLPAGDVVIRVAFSSLNYKDAMAATGHAGVVKKFPHVPGIDAAGTVAESASRRFTPGDSVIMTGHELGAERWGGWAEYVRVPGEWVVPLPHKTAELVADGTRSVPATLTLEESMILGTAGFTAAQGVLALQQHGITPDRGEVVVTGATGGVGSLAVKLLAKLGYTVGAVSGKPDRHGWLRALGASRIIGREEMLDESSRPLLAAKYAGGIDAVGGKTLATLIRQTQHRGCVATCGVVGGGELPLTVYPFILRGVTLSGIDSAWCPEDRRAEIWRLLAIEWKLDGLNELATRVKLEDVGEQVQRILRGEVAGRVVVEIGAS
jgi:putative YhdH/YhfP family quinone oxidoreductase